ncbi:coproporphyrinogen-III oxidase family protein [Kaarinaea lacus]
MSQNVNEWIQRARHELAELGVEGVKDSGILPERGKGFFPVVSYPPITMYSDMDESHMFDNFEDRSAIPMIGYLHIPFCPSRCTYCHWITKTKSKDEVVSQYIDYLEREMVLYKNRLGLDRVPVSSVLWGGGTPTYPKPAQLERLFKAYTTHYDLSQCTQFSVEAEPTTLIGEDGIERLKIMKAYGVNRVSLGVQSVDDDVLPTMGRAHNHAETLEAIENMRKLGFENIYIDLIYGYPGQTIEKWVEDMLYAANMDVDGYQLYRLRIKQLGDRKGNIINLLEKKPEKFHDADEIFIMKYIGKIVSEEHGFHEYQRRIFSKSDGISSHYLRDWFLNLYDVAGVGVSAWSTLRGVFSINIGEKDLGKYYQYIDDGKVAINRGKVLTFDDKARRSFMLPLKNDYVDKAFYRSRVGVDANELFKSELAWMKQLGMIEENEEKIWLTNRGAFFADEVTTQFFNPDYVAYDDIRFAPGRKPLLQPPIRQQASQ